MRRTAPVTAATAVAAVVALYVAGTIPSAFAAAPIASPPRHTSASAAAEQGRWTARFTDASGHPLAGVVVSAERDDSITGKPVATTTTGHSGRVTLALRPGSFEVDVDGSHATGGTSDAAGYVGTYRNVTIRPGRTARGGTTALDAAGAVHVHVVDTAGDPVEGVHPEFLPVTTYVEPDAGSFGDFLLVEDDTSTQPSTDAEGDVTVTGLRMTGAYRVCVNPGDPSFGRDSDFESSCSQDGVVPRAAGVPTTTVVVTRRPGGTVTGTLRDKQGRGFGYSQVALWKGRENLVASAQTRADGDFRVAGLEPGTYRVCAEDGTFQQVGPTGYQVGCAAHRVTVAGPSSVASATIVLALGAAVRGVVVGPHGVPVDRAEIDAGRGGGDEGYGTTDAHGRFVVKGLPAGRDTVCVDAEDVRLTTALPFGARGGCSHTRRSFTVGAGRVHTGVRITLRAGAAASGTVVDAQGRPVPRAQLEADAVGKGFFDDVGLGESNAHGRFTLGDLQPGRYRLCADSFSLDFAHDVGGGGVHGCAHGQITVHAGALRRHVRVVLPTTAAVRVTAVDPDGHGVAGVDATVIARCGRYCEPGTPLLSRRHTSVVSTGVTGEHGTVLLTGLRAGRYAVCLFAFYGSSHDGSPSSGYADRCIGDTFDVVVRAGHTTARRITLHPAGVVSGRITDAAGDPLAGVRVHVAGSAADDVPSFDLDDEFGDDEGLSSLPDTYSRTAADGTYTVRSVRPGDRLVCVDPTSATGGSSPGGYLRQCVGGKVGSTAEGAAVTVHRGRTTGGVDLALAAGGAVTGRATSAMPNAENEVVLLRAGSPVDSTEPSSSGAFHFRNLAPGTYTLCVDSYGRAERGRCWDDVAWNPQKPPPSDATPITVTAGVVTSGIDVSVPR
ncbi:carboxypeptidase regulatory-like domain-containing protein [Jatrophihabitans endophyticus]|uniref:carboxypeptidase regulatory-like domain-containing protein n=1 Tax=Jatrophihabitans endophyticus TaxID=1206085 RepID=UPI0019E72F72|nr:carboxypeptidase regulatory-like domain-containing protein [Jatrophihabitans endophyticus]MBE7186913.1 carboxypeptidase regulatory-like domain-containing protein [Jatrophihabitans endophyticus]